MRCLALNIQVCPEQPDDCFNALSRGAAGWSNQPLVQRLAAIRGVVLALGRACFDGG